MPPAVSSTACIHYSIHVVVNRSAALSHCPLQLRLNIRKCYHRSSCAYSSAGNHAEQHIQSHLATLLSSSSLMIVCSKKRNIRSKYQWVFTSCPAIINSSLQSLFNNQRALDFIFRKTPKSSCISDFEEHSCLAYCLEVPRSVKPSAPLNIAFTSLLLCK